MVFPSRLTRQIEYMIILDCDMQMSSGVRSSFKKWDWVREYNNSILCLQHRIDQQFRIRKSKPKILPKEAKDFIQRRLNSKQVQPQLNWNILFTLLWSTGHTDPSDSLVSDHDYQAPLFSWYISGNANLCACKRWEWKAGFWLWVLIVQWNNS